jgi:hypothetical protein
MTDAMLFSLEYNLLVDYFTYDYRKIIKRERLFKYSAEGATTPETLRQKDRYYNNSGKQALASPKD